MATYQPNAPKKSNVELDGMHQLRAAVGPFEQALQGCMIMPFVSICTFYSDQRPNSQSAFSI
jgi:hypothetical protein